jgi:hypothetical protein
VSLLALENANRVAPIIMDQIDGGKTYRYIADQLNGLALPTPLGGTWYAGTVRNYHKRLLNTQVT